MPRPHKTRKICQIPGIKGFRPLGIPLKGIERVILRVDENDWVANSRLILPNC